MIDQIQRELAAASQLDPYNRFEQAYVCLVKLALGEPEADEFARNERMACRLLESEMSRIIELPQVDELLDPEPPLETILFHEKEELRSIETKEAITTIRAKRHSNSRKALRSLLFILKNIRNKRDHGFKSVDGPTDQAILKPAQSIAVALAESCLTLRLPLERPDDARFEPAASAASLRSAALAAELQGLSRPADAEKRDANMTTKPRIELVEKAAKWITIFATLAGLFWSVDSALQARAIDARRPFLDLQLKLYQEATKTAAVLATSDEPAERRVAESRFWQLYWGELAMVENGGLRAAKGGVETAMVRFGLELSKRSQDRTTLQNLSLDLAHTCRDSLAQSWGVPDWKAPDYGHSTTK